MAVRLGGAWHFEWIGLSGNASSQPIQQPQPKFLLVETKQQRGVLFQDVQDASHAAWQADS